MTAKTHAPQIEPSATKATPKYEVGQILTDCPMRLDIQMEAVQGPEFDPRGWAVHLKMLAKRGKLFRVALAEVKKELQAPTRSRRAKATRPAKPAKGVAGACA